MHQCKSLKPFVLSSLVAAAGIAGLPQVASAELEASVGVANLYLFRGENLSASSPQVHGALKYSHGTGFYGGIWGSSEGSAGQEYDLYVGVGGESGQFSYDINLTAYEYPEDTAGNSFGDASEVIVTLGMKDIKLSLVDGLNSTDYMYYSIGFGSGAFGALIGMYDRSAKGTTTDRDYTHLDLSFAATDELKFTLSTIVDDDPDVTNDTLFVVNWDKSFDL